MYESISKNNELENEMTLDMTYFWYSDEVPGVLCNCCLPATHLNLPLSTMAPVTKWTNS